MILTKLGSHFVKGNNDLENDEFAILTVKEDNEEYQGDNMFNHKVDKKKGKLRRVPSKY